MKIVILLMFLVRYGAVDGLKCYTCSMTSDDIDQTCLTDPEKAGITDCDKEYCTTVRVDYLDPKGVLQSMSRNCVDTPLYKRDIIEDSTNRIYYRACQTELCNDGDGTDVTGSSSKTNGNPQVIIVPGIGGSAHHIVIPTALIISLQILLSLSII